MYKNNSCGGKYFSYFRIYVFFVLLRILTFSIYVFQHLFRICCLFSVYECLFVDYG